MASTIYSFLLVIFDGCPPRDPRSLAAFMPALILSKIRLRSNSAISDITVNTSLPVSVLVSRCYVKLRRPTFASCNRLPMDRSSFVLRANRSKRHTTSTSPCRQAFKAPASPDRSDRNPLALSEPHVVWPHPSGSQRRKLEVKPLVLSGHPRIANQVRRLVRLSRFFHPFHYRITRQVLKLFNPIWLCLS